MSETIPFHLRTESRTTPLGVDPIEPRFGWLVPEAVTAQTAYRIHVSTRPDASLDDALVWDSGPVKMDTTSSVPYAGPSLDSRTRYYWAVRAQDGDGKWTDWSEWTWFETGVRTWDADWLAPAGSAYETSPAPAPVFRTTFDVDEPVKDARLYITAGGTCVPCLNGQRVTSRALEPVQTDYEERVCYATYDVTDAVNAGENALAVVCGRERYAMTTENVWGWHDTPWHQDHPQLLVELSLMLTNGAEWTVRSDSTWRVGPSAIRFDSLYGGEVYDARETEAWSDPAFEDRTWPRAESVAGPTGRLVPQVVQPVEPVRTVDPESVEELGDGRYVVDFGEILAGWTRLSIDAPADTEVELIHGERLDDDGTVDVDQDHVDDQLQTDRYMCAGNGEETWEPHFDYKSFRYVQVAGLPKMPSGDTLTAIVAHTTVEADSASSFECSDDLLETLHQNTRRALLGNHHGIPTDTPIYEKNGWTGDAQLTAETALYNFKMAPFYRKWMADFADAQRDTGEVPPIVPTSDWGYSNAPHEGGILSPNPAWDAAYGLIPWWTYRYCGDRALLAKHYSGMKALVRWLGGYTEDGVIDEGLGDWLAPGNGEIRSRPPEGPAITSTAYYYRLAEVVADAARVLGRDDDAATFDVLASSTADALNDSFLDTDAGVYATGEVNEYRQTSNIFPLAYDIVPDEHRDTVLANLVVDIRDAHDEHLNTGILGTKYLLPTLTEGGHIDLAYAVASQTTYPSWGCWVEDGATSLYEMWELDSRSRNHHMYGTVDEWFYKYLAGIRPADPGFQTVAVEPHVPASLVVCQSLICG